MYHLHQFSVASVATSFCSLASINCYTLPCFDYYILIHFSDIKSKLDSGMCGKKIKLLVYKETNEAFESKNYLFGVLKLRLKLIFRFRSGAHGLNEELSRYSNRNRKTIFFLML